MHAKVLKEALWYEGMIIYHWANSAYHMFAIFSAWSVRAASYIFPDYDIKEVLNEK